MTEKRYTIFGEWHKDCVIDEIRDNTGEYVTIGRVVDLLNENEQLKDKYNEQSVQYEGLEEQVERLLDFKDNVFNLIDELIKKAEKDVEDLRKDAYEKGYAYNPYYYWGVAHGLEKLKKELRE